MYLCSVYSIRSAASRALHPEQCKYYSRVQWGAGSGVSGGWQVSFKLKKHYGENPRQRVVLTKLQPNGRHGSPPSLRPLARRSLEPVPGKVWPISGNNCLRIGWKLWRWQVALGVCQQCFWWRWRCSLFLVFILPFLYAEVRWYFSLFLNAHGDGAACQANWLCAQWSSKGLVLTGSHVLRGVRKPNLQPNHATLLQTGKFLNDGRECLNKQDTIFITVSDDQSFTGQIFWRGLFEYMLFYIWLKTTYR